MDTGYISNNLDDYASTAIKNPNNMIKAGVVALGMILSSNQMPINASNITSNTSLLTCIDGSFSTSGVYSNIRRHNFANRYRVIAKSEWFQTAYKNKSLGDITGLDA